MENGNIKVIEAVEDYKRIHKSIIRNENIDCITLGVYVKITLLGSEWNLNIKGLSKALHLTDSKIRKAIGILEKEGFIKRKAVWNEGRLNGWSYEVYPMAIDEFERSKAGYKIEKEEQQCCAESSVTEKQTTLKTVYTENGEDNNNILNKSIDLNNSKTLNKEKEGKPSKKKSKDFIPPTIEEVDAYIKEKGYHFSAKAFVEYYEADDWHYGSGANRKKMSNWKRSCSTWEGKRAEQYGSKDLFEQAMQNQQDDIILQKCYNDANVDEAMIYGIDAYQWMMMNDKQKEYYRKQDIYKQKLLKWAKEHYNG